MFKASFMSSLLVAVLLSGPMASAQLDDDTQMAPSAPTGDMAAQKAKRRAYPGGRDEEDLQVQPSLPNPTRNPDASAVTQPHIGVGGGEEPAAQD